MAFLKAACPNHEDIRCVQQTNRTTSAKLLVSCGRIGANTMDDDMEQRIHDFETAQASLGSKVNALMMSLA